MFLFKKRFANYKGFLILAAFLIAVFWSSRAQAIGVSPDTTILTNLANGVRVERTVQVTRQTTSGDWVFTVQANGEGARYIELSTTTFAMHNGQNFATYHFFVYPQHAPNGSYHATLSFFSPQGGGGGGQFSVQTYEGATAKVDFSITDQQILDYQIGSIISGGPTEVSVPPTINYLLHNTGNVDAKPDKIEINIVDSKNASSTFFDVIPGSALEPVPPAQEKNITSQLTKTLPIGVYKATTTFYKSTSTIATKNNIRIEVFPEGTLAQKAEFLDFKVNAEKISTNSLLKFDGLLKNTGQIGVKGTLYIQIKKNGQPIDLIKSSEKFVPLQGGGNFSVEFRPSESGTYTFDAYFSYGVQETNHKQVSVQVGSWVTSLNLTTWLSGCSSRYYWLLCIPWIILLIVLLIWWFKHRRCECDCHVGNSSKIRQVTHRRGVSVKTKHHKR